MFGICCILFTVVTSIAASIAVCYKNHQWNKDAEERAKAQGRSYYLTCDRETWYDMDKKISFRYELAPNGDHLKVGAASGKLIENMSETKRQEKADRQKERAKALGTKFYVKSIGWNFDGNGLNEKRMSIQKSKRLIRVVNMDTGKEYFRVFGFCGYYYQDLDTGLFEFAEVNPKYKNDPCIRLYMDSTVYPKTVENTKENIEKSRQYLNSVRRLAIQDSMREWPGDNEMAMNGFRIWGQVAR